jgi:hypothetical protein
MREVSAIAPPGSKGVEHYLQDVAERLAPTGARVGEEVVGEWRELFEQVGAAAPLQELKVGAGHGDWTQTNCAQRGRHLLLWDCERFDRLVPQGFDALHFYFNHDARPGWPRARQAAGRIIEQSAALLSGWSISAGAARATAQLYLLDIASRYLAENTDPAIAGGRVQEWLYPAVRESLRP